MARRMLKNILPALQTAGGISHPAKRNFFPCKRALYSNSDHPLSFCAYRYWSTLRHNENYENSHQLIQQQAIRPDVERNVRLFSQSSHCYNQGKKTVSDSQVSGSNKNKHVKAKKSSVKEFTINDKISEHDMSIKLTKMQNLLKKGKGLSIFIKHKSGSEGSKKSQMQETLQEHLQGVKSLRVEYSNKDTTRITVVPAEDGDGKISDATSDAKDKTALS